MRPRLLTFRLGLLAITIATLALAVIVPHDSLPPSAAQTTDQLNFEVTPANCGTVTVEQTSATSAPASASTSTPTPTSRWTIGQSDPVRVAAKANPGCTFDRFEVVLLRTVVRTSKSNPFQFRLYRRVPTTVRAHFAGTPVACTQATLGVDPATNSELAADCAQLLVAKDALRGTAALNWDVDTAMTSWDGVTLGGTPRRVTGLSLRMLLGTLPANLGDLTALTSLELEWGKLRGSIPTELSKLTKLRTLSLYRNSLSGGIPAELGKLTELRTLSLSQNFLTGSIPTEVANLTHLEGLFLYQNRLTGSIPAELEDLSSLTALFLGENQLSGCVPRALRQVTNNDLATLGLESCALPSATLSYSTYDTTGAVATAGSYAFRTESEDGAMTAVTTYEALRDGTATELLIHKSDAGGTSQAGVFDIVEAGDLFEWKQAHDCFVRYTVTEVKADPAGTVPKKALGVEWMTYAFTGCSGAITSDASVSVTSFPPNIRFPQVTIPVRHGPWVLTPEGWTGASEAPERLTPPAGRDNSYEESHEPAVVRAHPLWREPRVPNDWVLLDAASGYEGQDGINALYSNGHGFLALEVQITYLANTRDWEAPTTTAITETRIIDGLVAFIKYGASGTTFVTTEVRMFDDVSGIEYLVIGYDPALSGSSPDSLIAIARSLLKPPVGDGS